MPPPDQLVGLDTKAEVPVGAAPGSLAQHPYYYFGDGDLYVVAPSDNTIFRIHAHFLRKHSAWMQNQPHAAGSEEDNPLVLCEGVAANDFASILWVFYDETLERQASEKEWLSILLTAEKMQMPHVQLLARSKLEELPVATVDPIAKIAVQQRHSIRPGWALDAYLEVCTRPNPLTVDEALRIGVPAMVMIADVREKVARSRAGAIIDEDPANIVERVISQDIPPEFEAPLLPTVLDESETFEYIVEGASVVVHARDREFRVHRHFLETHSPLMRQMLRPASPGEWDIFEDFNDITMDADGLHISWLLALFYNETFFLELSPVQCIAIRAIAERYQMDKIGAFATRRAGNAIDLIDKVKSIGRFNIQASSPWASKVYEQIYSRRAPISLDEGERLTPVIWADISARREEALRRKCKDYERAAKDAAVARADLEKTVEKYRRRSKRV